MIKKSFWLEDGQARWIKKEAKRLKVKESELARQAFLFFENTHIACEKRKD